MVNTTRGFTDLPDTIVQRILVSACNEPAQLDEKLNLALVCKAWARLSEGVGVEVISWDERGDDGLLDRLVRWLLRSRTRVVSLGTDAFISQLEPVLRAGRLGELHTLRVTEFFHGELRVLAGVPLPELRRLDLHMMEGSGLSGGCPDPTFFEGLQVLTQLRSLHLCVEDCGGAVPVQLRALTGLTSLELLLGQLEDGCQLDFSALPASLERLLLESWSAEHARGVTTRFAHLAHLKRLACLHVRTETINSRTFQGALPKSLREVHLTSVGDALLLGGCSAVTAGLAGLVDLRCTAHDSKHPLVHASRAARCTLPSATGRRWRRCTCARACAAMRTTQARASRAASTGPAPVAAALSCPCSASSTTSPARRMAWTRTVATTATRRCSPVRTARPARRAARRCALRRCRGCASCTSSAPCATPAWRPSACCSFRRRSRRGAPGACWPTACVRHALRRKGTATASSIIMS